MRGGLVIARDQGSRGKFLGGAKGCERIGRQRRVTLCCRERTFWMQEPRGREVAREGGYVDLGTGRGESRGGYQEGEASESGTPKTASA